MRISIVASGMLALLFIGCGGNDNSSSTTSNATLKQAPLARLFSSQITAKPEHEVVVLRFSPIDIAHNDYEKRAFRISPSVEVRLANGEKRKFKMNYLLIARSGDKIGHGVMGMMMDKNGQPLRLPDGSPKISNNPDGNSLVEFNGTGYLVTHFEERPGQLYQTKLKVKNNALQAVDTKPIDMRNIGGTIINCASSTTPYGTHLGGEEDYSLNTRYADKNSPFYVDCALDGQGNDINGKANWFCRYVDAMAEYLHDDAIDKNNGYNGRYFTPYNYGYIVEVAPQPDGSTKVAKHYVTGKYTPELAVMMPDKRTLYISDDGTAKGFYKLVLDQAVSKFTPNWSGTLYAAKLHQLSNENGGKFKVDWVKLGHGSDSEIKSYIDRKMKLSDIFDIAAPTDGTCPANFKKIYEDSKIECLRLKPGQEKAAAFLETRKYAAYKGATIEFRKEEGITYDKDANALYIAMSEIKKSMEDNYKGMESQNDIRLPKNVCGVVYALKLDNNYNGTMMEAVVAGHPLKEGDMYADEWACHPDGIANPDNITYIGANTLLIGEDTTKHVNNMVWAFNTQTKSLTRIASLPIGAEVTGLNKGAVSDVAAITLNAQHPFEDNPKNAKGEKPNSSLLESATEADKRGYIGYIHFSEE